MKLSKIYKEYLKFNNKKKKKRKQITQLKNEPMGKKKKRANDLNRHLIKKDTPMANKHLERCYW